MVAHFGKLAASMAFHHWVYLKGQAIRELGAFLARKKMRRVELAAHPQLEVVETHSLHVRYTMLQHSKGTTNILALVTLGLTPGYYYMYDTYIIVLSRRVGTRGISSLISLFSFKSTF